MESEAQPPPPQTPPRACGGEHANAINKGHPVDHMLQEMADIAYVALGTLKLAGENGIQAMLQVADKNNSKTNATYELHPETGKVIRS